MPFACGSPGFESRDLQVKGSILSFLSVDNKKPRSFWKERGFFTSEILSDVPRVLHFFFSRPAVDYSIEGDILGGKNFSIEE